MCEKDRNVCFHCGGRLVWQNDFSYEDYGYEGEKFIGVQQDHTSSSNALFMIQHQEITKEEAKEIFNKYIDEMKVFE